jgi:hypothetical protein
MKRFLAILVLLLASVPGQAQTYTLRDGTYTGLKALLQTAKDEEVAFSGGTPEWWSFRPFDCDSDGDLDIVVLNHAGGAVTAQGRVFRNNWIENGGDAPTDLTFTDITSSLVADRHDLPMGDWIVSHMWDLNKDGITDIDASSDDNDQRPMLNSGPCTSLAEVSTGDINQIFENNLDFDNTYTSGKADVNGDYYMDKTSGVDPIRSSFHVDLQWDSTNNRYTKVSPSVYWQNLPYSQMPASIQTLIDATTGVARWVTYHAADLNNDGLYPDYLITTFWNYQNYGWTRLAILQADGTYADETAARGIPTTGTHPTYGTTPGSATMGMEDFNGDGCLDLIFIDRYNTANRGLFLCDDATDPATGWTHKVNADFDTVTGGSHSYPGVVFPVDADHDGDIDFGYYNSQFRYYENDGTGTLTARISNNNTPRAAGVAYGDFNLDGITDWMSSFTTSGPPAYYDIDIYIGNTGLPAHPRLWLDTATVASITAKKNANDADYLAVKAEADDWVNDTVLAYPNVGGDEQIGEGTTGNTWLDRTEKLALIGVITGTASYCTKVAQIVDALSAAAITIIQYDQYYPTRSVPLALALGFTWCHGSLSAGQRTAAIAAGNAWYDDWYASAPTGSGKNCSAGNNYCAGAIRGWSAFAMATMGENARATEILDKVGWMWDVGIMPLRSGSNPLNSIGVGGPFAGGYPIESWSYGPFDFQYLADYMRWTQDTGPDRFRRFMGAQRREFAEDIARMLPYHLKPDGWRTTVWGDFPGNCSGFAGDMMARIAANMLRPTSIYAKWLVNYYTNALDPDNLNPGGSCATTYATSFMKLIYWTTATATDYTATFPLAFDSQGDRHLLGRSDWTSSAIWWAYSPYWRFWVGHGIPHAGDLNIERGSDALLINSAKWRGADGYSGTPAGDDHAGWRSNVLYHNDDACGNYQTNGTARYIGGQSEQLENGTGQGEWLGDATVEHTDIQASFVYSKANLTPAYDRLNGVAQVPASRGVQSYKRSLITNNAGLFVIYDNATLIASNCTNRLYWHSPTSNVPTIASNVFTFARGSSKLFGTVLLPASASIAQEGDGAASYADTTYNSYRISVGDNSPSTTFRGLTVLEAKASTDTATTISLITSTGTTMYGALINGSSKAVYMFSADGTTRSAVAYTAAYSGVGTHVLADMTASTNFYWKRTGNDFDVRLTDPGTYSGPVASDSQGVLVLQEASAPAVLKCCKASNL